MKKKSTSKSKDRDKSKSDESRSHKHSRRRRKSSSESDSDASESKNDISEESKNRRSTGSKKEPENNVVVTRITRHSKRLAAISAGSDEVKEELTEVSSPVKTGKSSPFSGDSKGSPSKELKRKDGGTPDKHRTKDSEVWKVKSANGAGTGEIQKLKICRQRSPEPSANTGTESNDLKVSNSEAETPQTNNASENEVVHEQVAFPVNEEDIANIQLPSEDLQPPPAVEEIPIPEDSEPVQQTITYNYPIESNMISEDVSQICLPTDEPKQSAQLIEEITPVPVEELVKDKLETSVEKDEPHIMQTEEPVTQAGVAQVAKPEEPMTVEEPPQPKESPVSEVSQPSPVAETVEPEEPQEKEEPQPLPVTDSPRVSESEDNLQTELVLTVEENIEEAVDMAEPETLTETVNKKSTVREKELEDESVSKIVEPQELEEVYDYERDDTKEEGELSANESTSPIHEVFKRCPIGERTRSWGICNVSYFNRSNVVASEHILKEFNIKKRTVNKEEFDASDSEDLIFVKEIREENIVHEIESETNNTSYVDKDDDDIIPVSPKYSDEKESRKKRLSDSDRRKSYSRDRMDEDRSERSKRVSREGKSHSGEASTVLYITNLVRPFTINQLRELLQRTGKIVEDGFWIDSIKSKCYVQFESEDEALETRHALHGIRWPVNNPKVLCVQFATHDDLVNAQTQTHESEIPRKTEPLVVENHANDSRRGIDWKKHFEQYDERPVRKVKDVREWDIGKPAHPDDMIYAEPEEPRKNKEDSDKNRKVRKDRRRRDASDDESASTRKQRKTANESGQPPAEAKLLDDLFRRTKASPSIYWLPLSDEQIAIKQETRRKHLEDIDKQMKKRENENDRDRRRDRDHRRSRR